MVMNATDQRALLDMMSKVIASTRKAHQLATDSVVMLGFEPQLGPISNCRVSYAEFARRLIRDRRSRDNKFENGLFADPAWDIFLHLFVAGEMGQETSVNDACTAAAVAPTTALRWISALEKKGLVVKSFDDRDDRRTNLRLADQTLLEMRDHLRSIAATWGLELAVVGQGAMGTGDGTVEH
jgi:DNA-binding MarR family transcriptional regulator